MSGLNLLKGRPARCGAILLIALLCSACERPPPVPEQSPAVAPSQPEESELSRYLAAVPVFGASRAELATRFGRPDSVTATTVANRHDPAVADSIFTLFYDGLTAVVYRAGYDGKEMLAAVRIADPRHLTASTRPGIGAARQDVIAALGQPDAADDEVLEYTCEECLVAGQETLRFELARGAVARIEVQYWLD